MDVEDTLEPKRKDGQELVTRTFGCITKTIDVEARTVDVIMSTDTIDRYGEKVEQTWLLENYLRNPVVLWAHCSRELPVGRCENVRVEGGALQGTIRFASKEANPLAENCLQLFREKVLNAVSVGFYPHSYRWEKQNDDQLLILSDNELIELSCTPTPANPDALAKMRARARATDTSTSAEPSVSQAKETDTMDLKEFTAQLEQKQKEIADLNAKLVAAEKSAKDVLTAKDAEIVAITAKLTTETAKVTTLNERCATLETERNTQQGRANKATDALVDRDLTDLVGKKIAPAEKPGLVKLASLSPELYAEQLTAIKARPDMKMLDAVVKADETQPPSSVEDPANEGDALENGIAKDLAGQ